MSDEYVRSPKSDKQIDIAIKWWPYELRATTSDGRPQTIRIRCRGWNRTRAGINSFRVESLDTVDPLPEGLSVRDKWAMTQAIKEELHDRLGTKIFLAKAEPINDGSEWLSIRGTQI